MASSSSVRPARLSPLRSRHVSQGTLITASSQPSKIAVAAARPSSITTSTSVTPFSPDQAAQESTNQIETTGSFLSVSPTTLSPLPESSQMPRSGSAPDVILGSQRSQRATDEGSPTGNRRWPQPSSSGGGNDVKPFGEAESSRSNKASTPTHKKATQEEDAVAQSQYTRTQFQNQQHLQRHEGDGKVAAAALRSTGLAYDDVVETEDLENLCLVLGLGRNDVRRLRRQFNDEDGDNTYVGLRMLRSTQDANMFWCSSRITTETQSRRVPSSS